MSEQTERAMTATDIAYLDAHRSQSRDDMKKLKDKLFAERRAWLEETHKAAMVAMERDAITTNTEAAAC